MERFCDELRWERERRQVSIDKICEETKVVLISYVFGSRLPPSGKCVTTKEELRKLSRGTRELACYVVEVCPNCSWNHLARTFAVGGRARSSSS